MPKNIQIEKIEEKYRVRLHYTDRDSEMIFSDADALLDFIGGFLRGDGMTTSNIADLKAKVAKAKLGRG